MRKPFQGVLNIIRFNWHFYFLAISLLFFLVAIANKINEPYRSYLIIIFIVVSATIFISLAVSFYVYDLSGLYNLKWIGQQNTKEVIVNINAGFDETSILLKEKFKNAELIALDFYDPLKHTEISIKRAREAYPPFHNTKQVETTNLKLADNSADKIFVILSAHEIRNENERATFFKELKRILKPGGRIFITEHLRDSANFLAYNIGFFHFYSKSTWLKTFEAAELKIQNELKLTPFISTFILEKNGNSL
ncbi:MAG: methyltransferase domain-containing protein [Bacteroidota bacterium]